MEEALTEHKRIGRVMFPLAAFLTGVHIVGVMNNFYNLIPWFDVPLHLLWGITGALLFYWLIYRFAGYVNVEKNFFVTLIIVLGWTALGGVFWEFGEYFYDLLVYANGWTANPVQFGLDDTLGDIAFDLLGGVVVAVAVRLGYHKKRN